MEASQDLRLHTVRVTTPLAEAEGARLTDRIGLVPVLRAGLGMADAILETIPEAQVWHLGLYRDETTMRPITYYHRLPPQPTVEVAMLLDPMLATGGSAVAAVSILRSWGVPRIKYLGLIAAPEGISALQSAHPDVPIYLAAQDRRLNAQSYIVPGLGDAGDRQFGT
jgi:uracil phosphoribosyltransferase